ncbi:hypothetical protein EB796_008624 [Bugula neritina]|uniref:Uncharacterized protein n=1 Tax=Bugula neritina TaxID=10212 RepID=A0A7J7K4C7_BUGNE|nr:hypothetical protein EB796_008624 [Bugula neritina]
MMPATNSKSPPNGYVTTFTKSGRMVWQRMSSNINSQHRPWILQLPFIRQWNNARRNIHNHNGLGFFLLPAFQNNNTRLSEESMAVHTGASNNIFEDEEEDNNAVFWGLRNGQAQLLNETVDLVQRRRFARAQAARQNANEDDGWPMTVGNETLL